jgi:hypothetical protein
MRGGERESAADDVSDGCAGGLKSAWISVDGL